MSVLNPTKFHTTPEHAPSRFHLSVAVWRGGVWAGLALFAAVLAAAAGALLAIRRGFVKKSV